MSVATVLTDRFDRALLYAMRVVINPYSDHPQPRGERPSPEQTKLRADHPKMILRPDVTVGELTADVPAWCVPQDKFVALSRATLLRTFGAEAGLFDLHSRFRLECPHPGCRSPVLELWVRFVGPEDKSCVVTEE